MSAIPEDEAKTKWCPFSRVSFLGVAVACNRVYEDANGTKHSVPIVMSQCIGSACMAWRESGSLPKRWTVEYNGKTEDWFWDPRTSDKHKDAIVHGEIPAGPRGFCGLAGKP